MARNPYEVLGVPRTASETEIREAYRKLVAKYHPDRYHNNPLNELAEEKMREINAAYDEITSTGQRAQDDSGHYYAYGQNPDDPKQSGSFWGQSAGGNQNPYQRGQGPYYRQSRGCCSCDDLMCLCCADSCCECMGGDLIPCC